MNAIQMIINHKDMSNLPTSLSHVTLTKNNESSVSDT